MRITLFFILILNFSKAQFPAFRSEKWKKENLKNSTEEFFNQFGDTVPKSFCKGIGNELFVSWASGNKLMFNASFDGGKTWKGNADSLFPLRIGKYKLAKDILINTPMPSIAADTGTGSYKGRIYICWNDQKNGKNNRDVFLVYSDDKGNSWTEPILVTYYPNHKNQFNPVVWVNPLNGELNILYYDMQNYFNYGKMDVTLAISKNGGLKFDHYRLNKMPLNFFGIENCPPLFFVNENLPGWIELSDKANGRKTTVLVNDSSIKQYYKLNSVKEIEIGKSFKYSETILINFKSSMPLALTAALTKPLEPGFEKIIVKNQKIKAGNNKLLINGKEMGLQKESYILTLYYNNKNQYVWIIEE